MKRCENRWQFPADTNRFLPIENSLSGESQGTVKHYCYAVSHCIDPSSNSGFVGSLLQVEVLPIRQNQLTLILLSSANISQQRRVTKVV